jgi:hypothetical protein
VTTVDAVAVTALFESCLSAWRLEAQPTYAIPREQANIARWRAGEVPPAEHNAAWRAQVRGWTAAGKTIGRVRILSSPPTEYQRYQLDWSIPGNTAAGETVCVLDAATVAELGVPRQDFWVFEHDGGDIAVVCLNFDDDGVLIDRTMAASGKAQQLRQLLTDVRDRAQPFTGRHDHEV